MRKVECGGLFCWSDSGRFLPNGKIALISLFGPRNGVRAVWARLAQKKSYGVHIGHDEHISLCDDVQYFTTAKPIGKQLHHMVTVHPAATHHVSAFRADFLQIGSDPEILFFDRLSRMCPVPFRTSWRESLWRLGVQKGLIQALEGYGMPGYHVDTTEKWAGLVQEALKSKELV